MYCEQLVRPVRRVFRIFAAAQQGGVAVTFAIGIVPIIGLFGAAVDYSYANRSKSKLDAAADAAALAVVNKTGMAMSKQDAKDFAENMFTADVGTLQRATIKSISVNISENGNTRTAVVSYKAKVATAFMGLLGFKKMTVQGSSTAASAVPTYADFYLLLDNSPSMGVGATTADINTMVANTTDKCAFACHDLSAAPNDYYSLAKKLGVQMRIDVMRQATQQLMDTASDTQTQWGQFRMSIYTFGSAATSRQLTAIQPLTANLTVAKTSASQIDLMSVPYQDYAYDTLTDFGDVLNTINSAIATPGTGATSSSPLKYLFFVSDGVTDRALGSPSCSQPTANGSDPQTGQSYVRCQEPINLAFCTAMKNRGIRIAVLYTTYLPLPTNSFYNTWIAPFSGQIATTMESCASPGLYFEVSPTDGISDAMAALFKKAVQQARLTQ